jgi:putative inorganic carbon (HCO3(-)) transporter
VPVRDIIVLTFFAISLPVCFLRPFYGLLLWTVIAFMPLTGITWGPARSVPFAMAVAIPTLLGFFFFSRTWERVLSREFLLIVLLWVWFTITSFVSTSTPIFMHHAQDTWVRWEFVSKILLMTVFTMAIVDRFSRLRVLVLVIAGCFGAFILKTLPFVIITGGADRLYGPPNSMIGDNNDFALALNMTLPVFFFLAQTESNRWLRRLFGFLFVITIPTVFFTYSRGGLIGLVVVLGMMFFQLKRRLVLIPVIALGLAVALMFAPETWRQRMDPAGPNSVDASALSRINAWTFSWRLVSDYPIFGGGFETFTPEMFLRYAPNPSDVHGPHSVYMGVLAEHGFVGLFLYLALLGSCFASTHRLVKFGRLEGVTRVVSYANMFRFSLVGFLTSGLFLGRAYFDYFFTVVACIAILKRMWQSEWAGADLAEMTEEQVAA